MTPNRSDAERIEILVRGMFDAISWDDANPPDWQAFKAPCLAGAPLYPAARPVKPTTLEPFTAMLDEQRATGNLRTFTERVLRVQVQVFGNIATALASYATSINGGAAQRGVNGFLLVRTDGDWRIGAMCWDNEGAGLPLPEHLAP